MTEDRGRSFVKLGFSIIELLVVISIIAAILALLVPGLGKARSMAKRTACASNLRQIDIAIRLYMNSNDDTYPCPKDQNYILWAGRKWRPFIKPYLGVNIDSNNPSILWCPQDGIGKIKFESTSYAYSMTFYHTPEDINTMSENDDAWGTSLLPTRQKLFNVAKPSFKILIGEWFSNHFNVNNNEACGWWCWEGKRNYLFADGQVRYIDANNIRPALDGFPNPNFTINGIRGIDWPK
jgi:prepilin-type N-terminal cleavage/methylation domain-containing protein/prepilin-type processing-associated H-X9-DG protein